MAYQKTAKYRKKAYAGIGVFEENFIPVRFGWATVQYLSKFPHLEGADLCVEKGQYSRFFLFGVPTPIRTKNNTLLTFYSGKGTFLAPTNKLIGNFIPKLNLNS